MSKMQKKTTKKKKIERKSHECKDCMYSDKCDYKYGLSLFEKTYNLELDCWKRKVYTNLFTTGLHKQLNLMLKNDGERQNFMMNVWLHALNKEFDVGPELGIKN